MNPLLQDEELEDGGISDLLIEIGVIEGVSCIGECNSARIRSKLVDTLSHGQEVTRALRHFLSVEAEIAIAEVASCHTFLIVLPNSLMLIQRHSQMVSDEIFTGDAHIHGIPIIELVFKLLQLLFSDIGTLFGIIGLV